MITPDTPLSELTVRDLLTLLGQAQEPGKRVVHGIQGIADLFGVSLSQAKRIKRSGVIDRAVSQRGHTIVTDADLALRLWSESAHGRRKDTSIS